MPAHFENCEKCDHFQNLQAKNLPFSCEQEAYPSHFSSFSKCAGIVWMQSYTEKYKRNVPGEQKSISVFQNLKSVKILEVRRNVVGSMIKRIFIHVTLVHKVSNVVLDLAQQRKYRGSWGYRADSNLCWIMRNFGQGKVSRDCSPEGFTLFYKASCH